MQAGIIIHAILNLWETPGIEPVTSGLASVYKPPEPLSLHLNFLCSFFLEAERLSLEGLFINFGVF